MSAKVVECAPQVRCYKCGTTNIVKVCHHCGQAMCTEHSPSAIDTAGKPLSKEFIDLALKETQCGEVATHCEHCDHIVHGRSIGLIIIGLVIVLASIAIPTIKFPLRLVGVLIGSGFAICGYVINQKRREKAIQSRPLLPFFPSFEKVQVLETLRGRITVDANGRHNVLAQPVDGVLTITANFGKPERDRLQLYRKKYRLTDNDNIRFHVGLAVFKGPAGLRFRGESLTQYNQSTVIPMICPANAYPFLSDTGGRGSGEWSFKREYNLLVPPDTASLPIRIVSSLVPEVAQRALDLELQWSGPSPNEAKLTIDRIESFELYVPITWGEVESLTDNALIGTTCSEAESDGAVRTISWRRLSITDNERQEGRRTFFIRFENRIALTDTVRGKAEVTFKGTLSGLNDVELYFPLGGRREKEPADIKTRIIVDFELSLGGLRYQDVRVIPDRKMGKDENKPETVTFERVIPNHFTVTALTNAMSEQGFYVKRVIENPPRTGERANLINRYWDIAGRRYLGVYPIDYHLILAGEEVYSSEIKAQPGTTKTTLTVQGSYTNPNMEAQIENVWEQLNHLFKQTLQNLQQLPIVSPTPRVVEHVGAVHPSVKVTKELTGGDQIERVGILRKRLDELMEALIAGRISEKTYLELKANIEQELQAIQSGVS